ncbi:HWE histidine kinase domain-containing protein [Gilvibacter sediminis]|uniref:HWE histidine kinase domain-containing protein n=1 Tax=Gilvibacter sediminis TaxID=379071 RepID=UPI002350890E|nr:HWE histidine kinase domain-containing protein [Gilvibacter sediminis]MDC7996510.1 HWE histidine kinase domain-containing protein [Gilvibacter sediminis]
MGDKQNIEDSKRLEAEALEKCNSEAIEHIGQIQDKGFLLAFDTDSQIITYASQNTDKYSEYSAQEYLGKNLRDFFDRKDVHDILNIASHSSTQEQREHVKAISLKDQQLDVSLFRNENTTILEFVELDAQIDYLKINDDIKWALHGVHDLKTVEEVLHKAVYSLQKITGFDRVMAYRFLPDNSGEVVAEQCSPGVDSFLGLRFPAFDIPPRARDLFLKNPIRIIYNNKAEAIPILANGSDGTELDLTLSHLRSSSPVHLQYLINMGLVSSMTMPIIVEGKLWGLFAHHHHEILEVPPPKTYASEIIGQTISMVIEHRLTRNADDTVRHLLERGNQLISTESNQFAIEEFWSQQAPNLKEIIPCDGVAYLTKDFVLSHGNCPETDMIKDLVAQYSDQQREIFYSSKLNIDSCPSKGLLGMSIVQGNTPVTILFFRDAASKQVSWAGNPEKDLVYEKEGVRLHPRSSFLEYQKEHQDQADEWTSTDLLIAEKALETFKRFLSSKIEQQRLMVTENERLKVLVKELNHRVRNILALVQSITRQTASNEKSVESYIEALEKRITSLANANNMLTESSFSKINLRLLIQQELKPFVGSTISISLEGDDIDISSSVAPIIVLVIHELVTNSNKHGSLSVSYGKLFIKWYIENEDLVVEWREQDGPNVTPPKTHGFGMSIIENALEYEFDANTKVDFKETGLEVNYRIPLKMISRDDSKNFVAKQMEEKAKILSKKEFSVLVVEDDFINAKQLKTSIEKKVKARVTICPRASAGLKALRNDTFDFALLDVNLKNENSLEVALECKIQGVPFYYLTGYGDRLLENSMFPTAPVFSKPISEDELLTLIKTNHI